MPSLFSVLGYKVYFWSNEYNEPIHVHISKSKPIPNATKIWLTRDGGCVLAGNYSQIPKRELSYLMEIIQAQHYLIVRSWKEHFRDEEVKFFC